MTAVEIRKEKRLKVRLPSAFLFLETLSLEPFNTERF